LADQGLPDDEIGAKEKGRKEEKEIGKQ
jgi:hypothetical protein